MIEKDTSMDNRIFRLFPVYFAFEIAPFQKRRCRHFG